MMQRFGDWLIGVGLWCGLPDSRIHIEVTGFSNMGRSARNLIMASAQAFSDETERARKHRKPQHKD